MNMGYFRTNSDIKMLYEKAHKLTNDFTSIEPKILHKYPEILTVIRLGLGLPQRSFATYLGITRSSLAHYELGNKHMKYKREIAVCNKVNKILENIKISKETIFKNYQHLWDLAKKGQNPNIVRELGRKAISYFKSTEQENRISNILERSKLEFQRNAILNFDGIGFSFDFVIPNSNKPKVIIECKLVNTKSKKNFRIRSYMISYEIAYKFGLIKKRNPNIKRILILDITYKLPDRTFLILKKESEHFLINVSEREILRCIKDSLTPC